MSAASYDLLIVGGGQAARRAAEGAREVAPDISIGIVGEEAHAPYDRPPLSKAALQGPEGFAACDVRSESSYAADRIVLHRGQRVRTIDRALRTVVTDAGDRFGYGRLVLATGSRARRLPFPESVADQVLFLRTREDAERLSAQLRPGARLVVVGAGFIGLEVASAALARGAQVTVLEAADQVLARALPQAAAERVAQLHRAAGVDLRLGAAMLAVGSDGRGGVRVETTVGAFTADVVIVGIGVQPNVELAAGAGLAIDDGLLVDVNGATGDPSVFAAGEVTRHPSPGASGPVRLESWQVAELQAHAAGRSAAGAPTAHAAIPWFWSDQLGCNIQMLGCVDQRRPLLARDYPDGSGSLFALDGAGRIAGVIAFDAGRDVGVARRLMAKGTAPDPEKLADPAAPLRQMLS